MQQEETLNGFWSAQTDSPLQLLQRALLFGSFFSTSGGRTWPQQYNSLHRAARGTEALLRDSWTAQALLLQPEDPASFTVTLLHQRRHERCKAVFPPCKTLENAQLKHSVAFTHSHPAGSSSPMNYTTGWVQAVRCDFITKSQDGIWNIFSLKCLETLLWSMFEYGLDLGKSLFYWRREFQSFTCLASISNTRRRSKILTANNANVVLSNKGEHSSWIFQCFRTS